MRFFFPDWQSAGTTRAHDGAIALRRALPAFEPFIEVSVQTAETVSLSPAARSDHAIVGRTGIIRDIRRAIETIDAASPARIFSILGTCGAELAPVAYLNARYDGDLAVIWLDAHGDLNTPQSSPSRRFHGMILRTLIGEGDPDLTALVARRLEPSHVVLAGTRDLDPPERDYIQANTLSVVPPEDLEASSDTLVTAVRATGRRHVYMHLDLDVIDPEEFPNVLIPAPGGISVAALERAIRALTATFDCVGFSVVEYAPGPRDLTEVVRRIIDHAQSC